jgi:hypothetical protein
MSNLLEGELEIKRKNDKDPFNVLLGGDGWKKRSCTLKNDGFFIGFAGIDVKKIFSKKDVVTVEEIRSSDEYELFNIILSNKEIVQFRHKEKESLIFQMLTI